MRLFVGRQRIEASKEINEKFSQMQTLLFLSYTVIAIAGILFATSNIWYTLTRP
jgi:hypothetical protein